MRTLSAHASCPSPHRRSPASAPLGLALTLLLCLLACPTMAQEVARPAADPESTGVSLPLQPATEAVVETQAAAFRTSPPLPLSPNARFALVWRTRAVRFPDALLDIWFERHGSHWAGDQTNLSHGAEFTWNLDAYEVALAVDHADLGMASSFWQESDEGPRDAKWTDVDLQLLSFVVSTQRVWQPLDWLSPYLGAGVGAGFVLGEMVKYAPRRDSACYAGLGQSNLLNPPQCFTASGEPSPAAFDLTQPEKEQALPGVLPVLHLGTGLRARVWNRGVLKLEAGFQNYLYAGLALGGQW